MISRIWNSAVFWYWGFSGLRLASGLLLLPLIAHTFSKPDLGFYLALLQLLAIAPMLDMGMSVSIDRNISFAMGGAKGLAAHGLDPRPHSDAGPNRALLWQLLHSTRTYYRYLALVFLILFGTLGTYFLANKIPETSSPHLSWWAWGVALFSAGFEVYASWWNVFLRGMNQVVVSGRIQFLAHAVKLTLAIALLLSGGGLPSVFVAGAASSFLTRWLSRRTCLRYLGPPDPSSSDRGTVFSTIRVLWPNGWRVGLQLFTSYVLVVALLQICTNRYGLAGYSDYGLSLQVLSIVQGISLVWTSVKWPMVGQFRAQRDYAALRKLLWPRLWLQAGTFILLAILAHQVGPLLLELVNSDKQLLPSHWFLVLLIAGFLDTQVTFWTTLLSTENRVPSLWPVAMTNGFTLLLALLLIETTPAGIGSLVLAPLIAGSVFNYWYWPRAGAHNLKTSWWRFTFQRPGDLEGSPPLPPPSIQQTKG